MKSIFKSKTFWFNVLSGGLAYSKVLPIDPATQLLITTVGNVVLRKISKDEVYVVPPK